MVILGIESSAVSASVAVVRDGKLLSEMFANVGLTHSVTLMPMIKSVIESSLITIDDIDAISVSNGPGSFTGIRIGVATAKGLAQPSQKKCIPVSTLEAIAYPFENSGHIVASVMDARCQQVYCAFFDCGNGFTRLTEDDAFSFDCLCEKIKGFDRKVILAGDGADVAFSYLADKNLNVVKAVNSMKYQHASSVAFLAEKRIENNIDICTYDSLVPAYLRLSQAERELKKKKEIQ